MLRGVRGSVALVLAEGTGPDQTECGAGFDEEGYQGPPIVGWGARSLAHTWLDDVSEELGQGGAYAGTRCGVGALL